MDPKQEIGRIANFFDYLAKAIKAEESYENVANEVVVRLSSPIVDFLLTVKDATIVISQLGILLEAMCGPELTAFFYQESTIRWMNGMLAVLRQNKSSEDLNTKKQ